MTPMTVTRRRPANDVRIVPMTLSVAEVRLSWGLPVVSIGRVASPAGRWYWQHRDGEQSSPIAENRTQAATALADYHRAFKPMPAAPVEQPVRRLLFGYRVLLIVRFDANRAAFARGATHGIEHDHARDPIGKRRRRRTGGLGQSLDPGAEVFG